jgi:hypothetical protein
MTNVRVCGQLSARGLSNLVSGEKDFQFVVGNSELNCSRFQAQFVSPKVGELLQSDCTIDRFELCVENESNVIPILSSLLQTGEFELSDLSAIRDLSRVLGNNELLEFCLKKMSESVEESNVIERLNLFPIEEDVRFLASHFSSVCNQREMRTLEIEVLSRVLSDSELCLESEDSLFRLIESLCGEDEDYRVLIEFVEAQYLSGLCIEDYISFVNCSEISRGTWLSICRRLSLDVSPPTGNKRVKDPTFPIPVDGSSPFRGIFHYLQDRWKQNPHLTGKVKLSANDEHGSRTFEVYDLISDVPKTGKWWGTRNTSIDHYMKCEFVDFKIRPFGYALKSHSTSWGSAHYIQSWRFEGSNDDLNWTILDTQTNTEAISGNDKEAVFKISTEESYRFFRLITGALNSSGTHQFSMQRFEIFGEIRGSIPD